MKVSLIVLAALVSTVFLRKKSAALRHWVLTVAIFCATLAPVVATIVPSWQVPARQIVEQPSITTEVAFTIPAGARNSRFVSTPSTRSAVQTIWIVGTAIGFAVLLAGLGRLAWLAAHASEVPDPRWKELLGPVALLQSDHPALLVTWGLVRPKIILPASARFWSDDRMRIVLWHELAHIRRGDWLVHMMAELLRAYYWFNPILWVACRRLRQESEQACDDAVMGCGVGGAEYATELLGLARDLRQPRQPWLSAPAMARPSSLERRVRAMLNRTLDRTPITTFNRVFAVIALLLLTIPIATAQTFATFSGTVTDSQGLSLPDASLVLSNAQRNSRYEVHSSPTGAFEFVGLPAGAYTLEVKVIGFATLHEDVSIGPGQDVRRPIALKLGSLEETITVSDSGPAREAKPGLPFTPFDPGGCRATVGGNIRAPKKLQDRAPQYPSGGSEGTVVMDAVIGTDGYVKNIEVREGADSDLAYAAVTAVREWRFSQTILNCTPVEVDMKITTNFRHQR